MNQAVTLAICAVVMMSLALNVVAMAFAMWWFARSLTALAAGALNLRQVAAADGTATETDPIAPAASEPPPVESGKIPTRNRLSSMTDADLAAAIQDVKVITMDENNGIDSDVEPIPRGGRGVYSS